MITSNVRILRLNSIVIKTGIARSTIYEWLNPKSPRYDSSFPKPRKLGKQSVGWLESEIDGWINERAQASNEA